MSNHLVSSRPEDGFEVLERRITYRFALIASQMGSALAPSHLERYGISMAAWRVLAVIARHEPISATELAKRTSNDPFRVSRALVVDGGVDPLLFGGQGAVPLGGIGARM